MNQDFFPHVLLVDAVRVQLLRFGAEVASSCPALVASLPPRCGLIMWHRVLSQVQGPGEGLGTAGPSQRDVVLPLGSGSPPLLAAGREEAEAGFKLSLSRLRK